MTLQGNRQGAQDIIAPFVLIMRDAGAPIEKRLTASCIVSSYLSRKEYATADDIKSLMCDIPTDDLKQIIKCGGGYESERGTRTNSPAG